MRKGRARVGVVVGRRAQAPRTEGVGSSLSLLGVEGAAHTSGEEAELRPDRQLQPRPCLRLPLPPLLPPLPLPRPSSLLAYIFPFPCLSAESSWGQGALLKQEETWAVLKALKTFALLMMRFQKGQDQP